MLLNSCLLLLLWAFYCLMAIVGNTRVVVTSVLKAA